MKKRFKIKAGLFAMTLMAVGMAAPAAVPQTVMAAETAPPGYSW